MRLRKLLGVVLLCAPCVPILGIGVYMNGLAETLMRFGIAVGLLGVMAGCVIGVALLSGKPPSS
jgi:hypothetical protein